MEPKDVLVLTGKSFHAFFKKGAFKTKQNLNFKLYLIKWHAGGLHEILRW